MNQAVVEHGRLSTFGNHTEYVLISTRCKLIEIRAEQTRYGQLYDGGMFMGWGYSEVARFIAVGSTHGINQGSRARFCSVVFGRYSYRNSGGGTTHVA